MPKEYKRADRVADAIQRSLAQIIQKEVRDPRLGMVNVNAVTVTKDLSYAKVYVTFLSEDDQDSDQKKVEVLNNAASFMRSLMAKDLNIRTIPRLTFLYDMSVVQGQQLTELIHKARSSDKGNTKN